MSDLRKWRDEGASAEEQQLLEAARGERPDAALRVRTLEALGISGPAPGGNDGGGTGPAGASSGRLLSLVKLAGAVLAVGGVVTAGVMAVRGQVRPSAGGETATGAIVAPAPAPAATATPTAVSAPASVATQTPTPTPQSAPPPASRTSSRPRLRAASPRATPSPAARSRDGGATLADEVRVLEQAQGALAAGDAAGALKLCDRYQAAFAAGKLAPEETILRVRALLATGDRRRAVDLAQSFVSAHPDSPYATRLRAIIE